MLPALSVVSSLDAEEELVRGWQIVSEYVDRGISGSKDSLPQLNRLMVDAHQRKFDAIVVWKNTPSRRVPKTFH